VRGCPVSRETGRRPWPGAPGRVLCGVLPISGTVRGERTEGVQARYRPAGMPEHSAKWVADGVCGGWTGSRLPGSGSQAFARSGEYTAPTFGRTIPCCHAVVRRSRHDFLIRCFCHLFGGPSNRRPRRTLGSWLSWKLQVDHRQRCRQKPSFRRMIPPLRAVQSRRLAMRAVCRVTNPLGLG
jgi:hypothetical protein